MPVSQGKVREKQINFSRSGKSLGMLLKVKENLSSCQSQQTVREFKADARVTEAETKNKNGFVGQVHVKCHTCAFKIPSKS